jgi:AraC-like DNA-binding protein
MISTMYREDAPPAALAGIVECLWRRDSIAPAPHDHDVVLPDGRVDIVWITDGQALVAGPQTRFLPRPVHAPFVAVGARFEPGVGPALLGIPAHELVDLHVPLTAIGTRPAGRLARALARADGPRDAAAILAWTLAELAQGPKAVDPLVRGAVQVLARAPTPVGRLADDLALSERQLERRFRESVGYGPKTLQRVLRFRRFLSALDDEHDLARLAYSSGYADQAHLTRESRRLAGLSPAELRRLWLL